MLILIFLYVYVDIGSSTGSFEFIIFPKPGGAICALSVSIHGWSLCQLLGGCQGSQISRADPLGKNDVVTPWFSTQKVGSQASKKVSTCSFHQGQVDGSETFKQLCCISHLHDLPRKNIHLIVWSELTFSPYDPIYSDTIPYFFFYIIPYISHIFSIYLTSISSRQDQEPRRGVTGTHRGELGEDLGDGDLGPAGPCWRVSGVEISNGRWLSPILAITTCVHI